VDRLVTDYTADALVIWTDKVSATFKAIFAIAAVKQEQRFATVAELTSGCHLFNI
jgi:hypothetical protein